MDAAGSGIQRKHGGPAAAHDRSGKDADSRAVLARYGAAMNLMPGHGRLVQAVSDKPGAHAQCRDRLRGRGDRRTRSCRGRAAPEVKADCAGGIPACRRQRAPSETRERHPSGKPLQARELLMAGAQAMTEMIASGAGNINDLMFLALETCTPAWDPLATVCLRDVQTGLYKSRLALGGPRRSWSAIRLRRQWQQGPVLPGHAEQCRPAHCRRIDNEDPSLLPVWLRTMRPEARSFIILPLVVKGAPIGYFYAGTLRHRARGGSRRRRHSLLRTMVQVTRAWRARA